MAASIKDVAREAGVSIATVSRVLNNVDVVNEDTKKKVQDAIKKLSYRPNIVARSLKTQRTKTIGILVPDISNQFYPEVVRGAEDVANIYDYNIILCNSDSDLEKEKEYIRVLKEKMVDGMLYMSSSLEGEIIDLIDELELKTVLVETKVSGGRMPSVTIDNKKAAYDATKYLLDKGNKKVAYIGLKKDRNNAVSKRYNGYEKALKDHGMEVDHSLLYFGDLKAADGYNGINVILENAEIDAVFCASDEVAMGAINALRDKGISCPEDVDVMGFNDNSMAAVFYPKISTVAQPMYDMGSVGMRMLIKIVNNKPLDDDQYVLQYFLVERDSVKK
ncbi:LacI family DNA-binding transcriptional regulator [Proteiniclasticum sp.]|uniref:LacI family DNA-binding transcriptional regulator n=1 Tax=Proteiniclasticum sp. TaxID=2053595 RepID=UPI002899BA7E|nr:LacI family DNA-binding transcriptional regulator [Proteiniclasticum sp.]